MSFVGLSLARSFRRGWLASSWISVVDLLTFMEHANTDQLVSGGQANKPLSLVAGSGAPVLEEIVFRGCCAGDP